MSPRRAWFLFLLAATLPWGAMFATNALMGTPPSTYSASECTRACHDRGCHHDPVLPKALTSDAGLFGQTINALVSAGSNSGLSGHEGYGAVNLALFCGLWPGGMLALLGIGLRQRVRLARPGPPT